jgi:hypothetical protein
MTPRCRPSILDAPGSVREGPRTRLGAHPELSSAHHATCATCDHFPYSDPGPRERSPISGAQHSSRFGDFSRTFLLRNVAVTPSSRVPYVQEKDCFPEKVSILRHALPLQGVPWASSASSASAASAASAASSGCLRPEEAGARRAPACSEGGRVTRVTRWSSRNLAARGSRAMP